MTIYLLFLGTLACFAISPIYTDTRIINNTNLALHVDYDLPIYSRADTQITPIKSQQELQDLLYEAILTNSTQEIMQVVNAGADVNVFKDGKAPLMWATILKKFNSVETLKRFGAIIPCPKNMLYRAILNNSATEVKHAIESGVDIADTAILKDGLSPLGWAVLLAKDQAVQALLEHGAKITGMSQRHKDSNQTLTIDSHSPLTYSLKIGDIRTALLLLKHSNIGILTKKTIQGQDILDYLLGIDPTGVQDIILEFIQELINKGYDLHSPLYRAHIVNNEVTQYKSAWISAIESRFYSDEILALFMRNGANPNQIIYGLHGQNDQGAPLLAAIRNNNAKAVKFLIEAGADFNKKFFLHQPCQPPQSQTPLYYAQHSPETKHAENRDVIEILSKYGARCEVTR